MIPSSWPNGTNKAYAKAIGTAREVIIALEQRIGQRTELAYQGDFSGFEDLWNFRNDHRSFANNIGTVLEVVQALEHRLQQLSDGGVNR